MNLATVAVIAALLCGPAMLGLADGSMGPDDVGVRVLLAVLAAIVIEGVARRFVAAVRPAPVEPPEEQGGAMAAAGAPRRRAGES